MNTSRGLAMVGLVLAVAVGVLVASFTVSTNAAVVNGMAISTSTLNNDLSIISRSPAYQCLLLDDLAANGTGTGAFLSVSGAGVGSGNLAAASAVSMPDPATYSSTFTAYWLNRLITDAWATQWMDSHGLALSEYTVASARANLAAQVQQAIGTVDAAAQGGAPLPVNPAECPTSSSDLYKSLPGGFVDRLVEGLAAGYTVNLALAGQHLNAGSVADYYAKHRSDFDKVCLAYLPISTQSEVQQVTSAIAAGTSFESLAVANGGGTGCATPAGSSLANSLAQVAVGLPLGQLSSPLQTANGGYILVQQLSSATQPLSAVRSQVVSALVNGASSSGGKQVAELQRNSHVWVDPRYGHWVAAPVFSLETWNSPAPASALCPKANTTVNPDSTHCPPTAATGAATVNLPSPLSTGARKG